MNDSSNIVSASSMTRCVRSAKLILPVHESEGGNANSS